MLLENSGKGGRGDVDRGVALEALGEPNDPGPRSPSAPER